MKKDLLFLIVLGLAFLAANQEIGTQAETQLALIRAVQISALEFDNPIQLARWFKDLRKAGINTVIVKVFHNPGDSFHQLCVPKAKSGVYFRTDSAPVVCDLTGIIAQSAHKAGLKFYAWMNTRSTDYGWEGRTDLHSWAFDLASQTYLPQKALSPFHPEVRARLINLYLDLAQNPIDGVLIQDDLMLKHNEDFHPLALHLYFQEKQKLASPEKFYLLTSNSKIKDYTPEFWEWNEWKINKLLDLADELRKAIKSKRPSAKFGMNFYYETALIPEKGRAWFSQDLKRAGERKYDFYALMLYHRQMQEELRISDSELGSVLELAGKNFFNFISGSGVPVIKLMVRDFHSAESIPARELEKVSSRISERSGAGLALFPVFPGREMDWANLIVSWEDLK